jgi:CheY-like chemotaxis protein
MEPSQSYVLVINQGSEDLNILKLLLQRLQCSVAVVNSMEQAVHFARQGTPYLVIVIGNHPNEAHAWVRKLRWMACSQYRQNSVMIVALTDISAPSWLHQEENPGFDGFLVKPIEGDVLTSLVQSAWARQACCAVN